MSAPPVTLTAASAARQHVLDVLESEGIPASLDAGAFFPAPCAALIGLPTLLGRGLASSSWSIPVTVVSGDTVNTVEAVDRLYAMADAIADALNESGYRPRSWQAGVNREPLPAVEIVCTVTLSYKP